jgi:hypothetical protein
MARLILVGIGGTGARVMRAFTFLLAGGVQLCDITEVVPCIIDTDKENGDTDRCKKLIDRYNKLQGLFNCTDSDLFKTKFAGDKSYQIDESNYEKTFSAFIGYDNLIETKKAFLKTLFNDAPSNNEETELHLNLKEGFKGNPNIGTVVFNEIQMDKLPTLQDGDRIFFISSIFGGTGASGFPTILKSYAIDTNGAELDNFNLAIKGGISVQPYFNVHHDLTKTIHPKKFISKTKSALNYYATDDAINMLNCLYYIGDSNWNKDDTNKLLNNQGKAAQKNPAHIIDFLCATAIVDFAITPINTFKDSTNNEKPNRDTIFKEVGILPIENNIIRLNNFEKNFFDLKLIPILKLAIQVKLFKNLNKLISSTFYKTVGSSFWDGDFIEFNHFLANFEEWLSEMNNKVHYTKAEFFNLSNDDDWTQFFVGIGDKSAPKVKVSRGLINIGTYDIGKNLNTFYNKCGTDLTVNQKFNKTLAALLNEITEKITIAPNTDKKNQHHMFRLGYRVMPTHTGWNNTEVTKITETELSTLIDENPNMQSNSYLGSSIPSVFGRIHLMDTAFKICARDLNGNTPYHKLVSDTLDLIELLFIDNHNIDIKVCTINDDDFTNGLKKSIKQAKAQINNYSDFKLIYYKFSETDKVLLGATSPLTFVYTSPNLQRDLNGRKIKGFKKDDFLFDDRYLKLNERHELFISYFLSLSLQDNTGIKAFKTAFSAQFNLLNATTFNVLEEQKELNNDITGLHRLKDEYFIQNINESSFLISCNKDPKPLFLFNSASTNKKYVNSQEYWKTEYFQTAELVKDIDERKLMGIRHIKYPFYTEADFLQDYLIEIDGGLDSENFIIGTGNTKYLLPLKNAYFEVLDINDLEKKISFDGTTFNLSITLNGGVHTISKTYQSNEIKKLKGSLSIFPMIKKFDDYQIAMVHDDTSQLKFNSDNPRNNNFLRDSSVKFFVETMNDIKYIPLDFCIENEEYNAFVVPKLEKLKNTNNALANYAVDFGTSNTYIAYKVNEKISSLVIEEKMIGMLTKTGDSPNLKSVHSALKSNFLPIGQSLNNPLKTALIYEDSRDIFKSSNIGYTYSDNTDQNIFHTNFKWDKNEDNKRISFIKQLYLTINAHAKYNNYDIKSLNFSHPKDEKLIEKNVESLNLKLVPTFTTESIAPFYFFKNKNVNTLPLLNIDIGGGSSDVVYVTRDDATLNEKSISMLFAGNNIWKSDRLKELFFDSNYFKNLNDKEVIDKLSNYKDARSFAEDILSAEERINFERFMVSKPDLFLIPLLHNFIILYYVKDKLEISNDLALLSFTGNGSKYLQLLPSISITSYNTAVKSIFKNESLKINSCLSQVTELGNNFDPKKITAEGVLSNDTEVPTNPINIKLDSIDKKDLSNKKQEIISNATKIIDDIIGNLEIIDLFVILGITDTKNKLNMFKNQFNEKFNIYAQGELGTGNIDEKHAILVCIRGALEGYIDVLFPPN